jgi:glycosyltransferase involved in cell wall biosynthesis
MLTPKISVVTPSFNSLTTIRETNKSVRKAE